MPFSYQTFYHLSSELLVHYSRHGLNNGPFNERTVLEHLNTKLVFYSDPHCTGLVHNLDPLCSLYYDFCLLQLLSIAVDTQATGWVAQWRSEQQTSPICRS